MSDAVGPLAGGAAQVNAPAVPAVTRSLAPGNVARLLPYAAVSLAAISWGCWGLIVRSIDGARPIPPAIEATILFAVMAIVSGITSFRDRVDAPAPWRARAWVAFFGVSDALNVSLFFAAYKITIGPAVLAHYLTPILVALAAPLVLREAMTARTGVAVAASFLGLVVMLAPTGQGSSSAIWLSAGLGAASAVFYASNVLVNKAIAGSFSTSEATFWHCVVAVPCLAMAVPHGAWASVDPRAVAWFAVASIGPGALAGLAFVWGLRRMPAAHASTLTLLEPLVSIVLGASVMGERLGPRGIAGAALIVGSAAVVASAPAQRA
jgi:drug/metabolite transporter (DMT)-like permease